VESEPKPSNLVLTGKRLMSMVPPTFLGDGVRLNCRLSLTALMTPTNQVQWEFPHGTPLPRR
jgi:hypothetical protein